MFKKLNLFVLSLFLFQVPLAAEIPDAQFTILPTMYIDTDRGTITWLEDGALRSGVISDCSNAELHCLKSEKISLVWPRVCGTYVADASSWSREGVETRVVGYTTRIYHHTGLNVTHPIIMTEGHPEIAFVLDKGRIRGAFVPSKDDASLKELIASSNSSGKFDLIDSPPATLIYAPVLSTRWLGKCEK